MDWNAASVAEEQIRRIREQVGDGQVICGLSGGVDSSVAALLVHRAIGDQLTCVFVDHGLMRKGEGDQVVAAFRDHFKVPLVAVDAEERFLAKLAGVTEPEAKRKIIGNEFIRVFEEEAAKLEDPRYLVQGTLYSDVIESGGDGTGAAAIKSHHNVGGLPEDLEFELVEPLRALFKDEVRQVGLELGLPERLVWRQPFPGPGLGIRIVGGEVNRERLEILRDADYVLQDEIRGAGLYRDLWQSFCVLPGDLRTVGVQGDERTYGYVVVIRAVTSDDAMTADWARLPYDLLERIASRMINEIRQVNRVVLDVTSKPPGHHRVGVSRGPVLQASRRTPRPELAEIIVKRGVRVRGTVEAFALDGNRRHGAGAVHARGPGRAQRHGGAGHGAAGAGGPRARRAGRAVLRPRGSGPRS